MKNKYNPGYEKSLLIVLIPFATIARVLEMSRDCLKLNLGQKYSAVEKLRYLDGYIS